MSDPAAFERYFGAAMAGVAPVADPAFARAVAIHRNTAFKAATDALADNFPVLRTLSGDEAFAACARAFVVAKPPSEPRLCVYGARFADFVLAYEPFAALPWLTDVAALEWLCVEALFASDALALDGVGIAAGLDPVRALPLHPAVRFSRLGSPAASIWLAHQTGAPVDALERITWSPEVVLVTRPHDSLIVGPIDPGALAFLEACVAGFPLEQAAAAAAATDADVATVFSRLINAGAFACPISGTLT